MTSLGRVMTRKGKTAVESERTEIDEMTADTVYVEYAEGQLWWHLVVYTIRGESLTETACPPGSMPEVDGRNLNRMVARALGVA